MSDRAREIADNRKLWDAWTPIHTSGSFYDAQRFRDDPDDVRIEPWERAEVGDITRKTLLHVQCHFGLDTLSWARLGAAQVTGVDFSEPAIAFARELAQETGLAERSRFVVSDVYDLPGPLAARRSMWCTRVAGRSGGCPTWSRGPRRRRVRRAGRHLLHPRGHPVAVGARRRATPGEVRLGVRLLGRRDA
jgi:SAM-dependent methyltransferase